MKPLDFLIIGAQKCATTALFEHLRGHPDIAMPLEKEVPFFTGEDCSEQAWSNFASEQFGCANQQQLWGKATPQYMSDPLVPARMKQLMPDVKLVAILRDPIERTWSHFQMGKRRDTEAREFADAIEPLLHDGKADERRTMPVPDHAEGYESEADFYVGWSEYGRSLTDYAEHFDPENILVLYTEDLESQPEETLDKLLEFIGLPQGYRPSTLGKVIHKGGSGNRIPPGVRTWLRDQTALFWLWQQVPDQQRGRLRFKYEQWNVRKKANALALPEGLYQDLTGHYESDLRALMNLHVPSPPWLGRYVTGE
ncbi:MAG: hypothetical protein ACI9JM_001633 [Halioglobus sp.]|jgi:hypothetical protein